MAFCALGIVVHYADPEHTNQCWTNIELHYFENCRQNISSSFIIFNPHRLSNLNWYLPDKSVFEVRSLYLQSAMHCNGTLDHGVDCTGYCEKIRCDEYVANVGQNSAKKLCRDAEILGGSARRRMCKKSADALCNWQLTITRCSKSMKPYIL